MSENTIKRRFSFLGPHYQHFHFVFFLHYIRKYILITLLPLLTALVEWDLDALFTSLRQAAFLLAAISLAALALWQVSGWYLDTAGVLHVRSGLIFRRHLLIRGSELSAVRTDRALWMRPLGAGQLTLYYARVRRPGTVTLYLTKSGCTHLADALLPVDTPPFYRPVGAEKLSLAVLSVNMAATALILYAAIRQTRGLGEWAERIALAGLGSAVAQAATFLPVGAAWCLFGLGVLLAISFLRGCFHTARYRVSKTSDCVLSSGGLLHLSECRVRLSAVTACDIRATPTARLLHRLPVYLIAGTYTGGELPVLLLRPGQEAPLKALLPGIALPGAEKQPTAGRSYVAFILWSGILSGLSLLFLVLSVRILPEAAPAFALILLAAGAALAVGLDGRRREGIFAQNGRVAARVVKHYTLHTYCLFGGGAYAAFRQNPWAVSARRGNLILHLRAGVSVTVKSIPEEDIRSLRFPAL